MELVNEFRVPVAPATTWKVLTDVERVAPCIPGAELLSVDGDAFTGAVKVKVGPITVSYKGDASFQEKDEAAQRVVIRANGKETRGSGNVAAVVTAQLHGDTTGTTVSITTDLTISGKAAQFGRGVLADVASNLIAQFAKRLEADVLGAGQGSPNGQATHTRSPATTSTGPTEAGSNDSVDLLKVVAVPLAKRAAPIVAAVAAGAVAGFVVGRRRARPQPAAQRVDDLLNALSRLVS